MHPSVQTVLDETKKLWQETASLTFFIGFPDDLAACDIAANNAPVAQKIKAWQAPPDAPTTRLHKAVQAAASHVNWQFIYSEDQVGRHFLDNYAYFELIGPTGHFQSAQCNAYIGYWGPDLYYPAHYHASEELYFVLSGAALFESEGVAPATLGPGASRFHASYQPHAMTTKDSAILTLVLWRGPDLNGLSQLVLPAPPKTD